LQVERSSTVTIAGILKIEQSRNLETLENSKSQARL